RPTALADADASLTLGLRVAVLICSPPRSLRPPALAGRRYSLAVGSRCSSARLRARCARRPWRAGGTHSLSARGAHLLASALAALTDRVAGGLPPRRVPMPRWPP